MHQTPSQPFKDIWATPQPRGWKKYITGTYNGFMPEHYLEHVRITSMDTGRKEQTFESIVDDIDTIVSLLLKDSKKGKCNFAIHKAPRS